MKTPHTASDTDDRHYLCDYAQHPLEECYCLKLNGKTVPSIVSYCMDRYRECPIYRAHVTRS